MPTWWALSPAIEDEPCRQNVSHHHVCCLFVVPLSRLTWQASPPCGCLLLAACCCFGGVLPQQPCSRRCVLRALQLSHGFTSLAPELLPSLSCRMRKLRPARAQRWLSLRTTCTAATRTNPRPGLALRHAAPLAAPVCCVRKAPTLLAARR